MELLSQMVTVCTCEELPMTTSFYISVNNYEDPNSSKTSPKFVIICLFNYVLLNGYEVVSPCSFDLDFSKS